jgi:3-oxoacyl-[acyl-carrier-protein] synthase II
LDNLDPACELPNLVAQRPVQVRRVRAILNNSFGMLGINSAVVVTACE